MGFGNGYSSRSDHGGKRYSNDMVAHVWNAQSERAGQSGNGNFYFSKRTLYSYGSHFVVGFIMPDGVAFLNADSYSVSTGGHQGDARGAIKNRRHASIAGLTDIAGEWKLLPRLARYLDDGMAKDTEARDAMRADVRRTLLDHAVALSAVIYPAGDNGYGEWISGEMVDGVYTGGRYGERDSSGDVEAGAYLAALVGLPVASWPKIKRDAADAAAKAKAAKAAADAGAAADRALKLADMPARQWREHIARLGSDYSAHGFDSLAKELRRARKLMLAAKGGKLATAGRIATIRARIKQVASERDSFDAKRQGRVDRNSMAVYLATVRNWRDASEAGRMATSYHAMVNLERAAQWLAEKGRTSALRASAAKLASEAEAGSTAIRIEDERKRAVERENAAKAQVERIRLWLAGEQVGSIRFDAATGGAAMRIVGDTLQTSHGAEVPLSHAVKAFRFVKLMRERGEGWRRNGHTVRVGHFQVDSIRADGSFTAGCHDFTWPEVERVAKLAGVFDCDASDSAVESSLAHA